MPSLFVESRGKWHSALAKDAPNTADELGRLCLVNDPTHPAQMALQTASDTGKSVKVRIDDGAPAEVLLQMDRSVKFLADSAELQFVTFQRT